MAAAASSSETRGGTIGSRLQGPPRRSTPALSIAIGGRSRVLGARGWLGAKATHPQHALTGVGRGIALECLALACNLQRRPAECQEEEQRAPRPGTHPEAGLCPSIQVRDRELEAGWEQRFEVRTGTWHLPGWPMVPCMASRPLQVLSLMLPGISTCISTTIACHLHGGITCTCSPRNFAGPSGRWPGPPFAKHPRAANTCSHTDRPTMPVGKLLAPPGQGLVAAASSRCQQRAAG